MFDFYIVITYINNQQIYYGHIKSCKNKLLNIIQVYIYFETILSDVVFFKIKPFHIRQFKLLWLSHCLSVRCGYFLFRFPHCFQILNLSTIQGRGHTIDKYYLITPFASSKYPDHPV